MEIERKRKNGESDDDYDVADLPLQEKNQNYVLETVLKLINQEMDIMSFGCKILEMIPSKNKFKKLYVFNGDNDNLDDINSMNLTIPKEFVYLGCTGRHTQFNECLTTVTQRITDFMTLTSPLIKCEIPNKFKGNILKIFTNLYKLQCKIDEILFKHQLLPKPKFESSIAKISRTYNVIQRFIDQLHYDDKRGHNNTHNDDDDDEDDKYKSLSLRLMQRQGKELSDLTYFMEHHTNILNKIATLKNMPSLKKRAKTKFSARGLKLKDDDDDDNHKKRKREQQRNRKQHKVKQQESGSSDSSDDDEDDEDDEDNDDEDEDKDESSSNDEENEEEKDVSIDCKEFEETRKSKRSGKKRKRDEMENDNNDNNENERETRMSHMISHDKISNKIANLSINQEDGDQEPPHKKQKLDGKSPREIKKKLKKTNKKKRKQQKEDSDDNEADDEKEEDEEDEEDQDIDMEDATKSKSIITKEVDRKKKDRKKKNRKKRKSQNKRKKRKHKESDPDPDSDCDEEQDEDESESESESDDESSESESDKENKHKKEIKKKQKKSSQHRHKHRSDCGIRKSAMSGTRNRSQRRRQ